VWTKPNDDRLRLALLLGTKNSSKQDRQALLKAKYCPRISAVVSAGSNKVRHLAIDIFANPGQLVETVSCTQVTHRTHVTLTFDL